MDDFANQSSVESIKESALKLDFSFDLINVSRVADILPNLNTKKSAGPDRPNCLRLQWLVIAGPLTKLFNHCYLGCLA